MISLDSSYNLLSVYIIRSLHEYLGSMPSNDFMLRSPLRESARRSVFEALSPNIVRNSSVGTAKPAPPWVMKEAAYRLEHSDSVMFSNRFRSRYLSFNTRFCSWEMKLSVVESNGGSVRSVQLLLSVKNSGATTRRSTLLAANVSKTTELYLQVY
jgi:hypothetical protein